MYIFIAYWFTFFLLLFRGGKKLIEKICKLQFFSPTSVLNLTLSWFTSFILCKIKIIYFETFGNLYARRLNVSSTPWGRNYFEDGGEEIKGIWWGLQYNVGMLQVSWDPCMSMIKLFYL
uniref:Uncharacterized protein n=1 Tax=Cacopsylla melanoneura TaxID=428564 RepID=A0A8D8S016_9HEMI